MIEVLLLILVMAIAVAEARAGRPKSLLWFVAMAALIVAGILVARADPGKTVLTWHPIVAVLCFGGAVVACIGGGISVLTPRPKLTKAISDAVKDKD